jgi:hypothetical protein
VTTDDLGPDPTGGILAAVKSAKPAKFNPVQDAQLPFSRSVRLKSNEPKPKHDAQADVALAREPVDPIAASQHGGLIKAENND